MAQKSIPGNPELAKSIKSRRNELNLTIEEAAQRAGVGTKTWCRYEAGAAIRADKCKGIRKALNWRTISDCEGPGAGKSFVEGCRGHEAWSPFLAENYGDIAAASFAAGSDILLDHIREDLADLASMPAGSHIGQLGTSFLCDDLPPQFRMCYDYDFLYHMKCVLLLFRRKARHGTPMIAHSVLDELILYLCSREAMALLELEDDPLSEQADDWVFDLFGDEDVVTFLYSNFYLDREHPYHFTHWNEQCFYIDE